MSTQSQTEHQDLRPPDGSQLPAPPSHPPVAPDRRGIVGWIAALLAVAVIATLVAFGIAKPGGNRAAASSALAATARTLHQSDQPSPQSAASNMIGRILPSVVNVRVVQVSHSAIGQVGETKAEGSGIVLASNGVILTNNHVVERAVSVRIVFTDGHQAMSGTVVGTDPQHDLAVVKVDATGLTPVQLGRSSDLKLADTVYAIGFPLDLGVTVTRGIVSGLDRSVSVKGESGVEHLVGLLQTDAAINPGNSGGPLVDASGQVVGINTAGVSAASADNVGFAIAIDDAVPVVKQILTQPVDQQAWLGVEAVSVDSSAAASALGLAPTVRGAAIVGVLPSSPAAAAGLRARDVIVSLDGRPITSGPALDEALSHLSPGQFVQIGIQTPSGRRTVQVRLGQRPRA